MRHLFNKKMNVERVIKTEDGLGSYTETWQPVFIDVPCRINWVRGNEKIFFSKNSYFRDAKIFCGIIDIGVKDRVVIDGQSFDIVNVSNVDNVNKYLTLEVKKIE